MKEAFKDPLNIALAIMVVALSIIGVVYCVAGARSVQDYKANHCETIGDSQGHKWLECDL